LIFANRQGGRRPILRTIPPGAGELDLLAAQVYETFFQEKAVGQLREALLRDDGIDVHGAARGDVARGERKHGKHRGDAGNVAKSFGATRQRRSAPAHPSQRDLPATNSPENALHKQNAGTPTRKAVHSPTSQTSFPQEGK
jgi:hypothetical protein